MRRFLLIAATGFICQLSFAQAEFGIKAGLAINSVKATGSANSNFDNVRIGYTFGATLDIKASSCFTVQPELNYLGLSARKSVANETWNYSYITLPILLKYNFEKSTCNVYVGPQLGFLSSGKAKINGEKVDNMRDLNNTDFAVLGGIDYRLPNGIRLDLRYTHSTLDLVKVEANSPIETRSNIVTFTVGYVFGTKK